jgi:hypothetical protein
MCGLAVWRHVQSPQQIRIEKPIIPVLFTLRVPVHCASREWCWEATYGREQSDREQSDRE